MGNHYSSGKRGGEQQRQPHHRSQNGTTIEPQAVSQAIRSDGGAGGMSGTGQALPHHGFDVPVAREALRVAVGDEAALPMPANGHTYQTGGAHLNRERVVEQQLRKARASNNGLHGRRPPASPPPGAPVNGKSH